MAIAQEKKSRKRESIMDAGFDLFLANGVEVTSIDDIVRRAGIAKGTFYLYFKNKYELLEQVILRQGSEVLRSAFEFLREKMRLRPMTADDMTLCFTSYLVDFLAGHKALARLIRNNLSIGLFFMDQFNDPELSHLMEAMLGMVTDVSADREQTRRALYLVVSMVGSVCCDAILYGKPYTLEEIKPMLYRTVLKMGKLNWAE